MQFFLERLREPSTFAGIAAFLAGLGVFGFGESEWNQIFGAVASVAGAVAIFMREPHAHTSALSGKGPKAK
jgi:hypothetical protein